ncbi:MAG: ABC transporter permease [Bilifractor sp.]
MKIHKNRYLISAVTVMAIVLLWISATTIGGVKAIFIPSIPSVWEAFVTTLTEGYKGSTLLQHLGTSLGRLLIAYVLVIVTAVPLGLLSGYHACVRAVLEPVIEFYRPLPPLAYYTILVLWMGIGESSKLMLLYLAGFAPVYISCVSGVIRIRRDYITGARTLGANNRQIFFHVIFPAALPDIFTGLRTAVGFIYTTLVAAEMVAATRGIGWMVLDASNYLRSDVVFMGVIIMGITGILLNRIVRVIEEKTVHWKGHS